MSDVQEDKYEARKKRRETVQRFIADLTTLLGKKKRKKKKSKQE